MDLRTNTTGTNLSTGTNDPTISDMWKNLSPITFPGKHAEEVQTETQMDDKATSMGKMPQKTDDKATSMGKPQTETAGKATAINDDSPAVKSSASTHKRLPVSLRGRLPQAKTEVNAIAAARRNLSPVEKPPGYGVGDLDHLPAIPVEPLSQPSPARSPLRSSSSSSARVLCRNLLIPSIEEEVDAEADDGRPSSNELLELLKERRTRTDATADEFFKNGDDGCADASYHNSRCPSTGELSSGLATPASASRPHSPVRWQLENDEQNSDLRHILKNRMSQRDAEWDYEDAFDAMTSATTRAGEASIFDPGSRSSSTSEASPIDESGMQTSRSLPEPQIATDFQEVVLQQVQENKAFRGRCCKVTSVLVLTLAWIWGYSTAVFLDAPAMESEGTHSVAIIRDMKKAMELQYNQKVEMLEQDFNVTMGREITALEAKHREHLIQVLSEQALEHRESVEKALAAERSKHQLILSEQVNLLKARQEQELQLAIARAKEAEREKYRETLAKAIAESSTHGDQKALEEALAEERAAHVAAEAQAEEAKAKALEAERVMQEKQALEEEATALREKLSTKEAEEKALKDTLTTKEMQFQEALTKKEHALQEALTLKDTALKEYDDRRQKADSDALAQQLAQKDAEREKLLKEERSRREELEKSLEAWESMAAKEKVQTEEGAEQFALQEMLRMREESHKDLENELHGLKQKHQEELEAINRDKYTGVKADKVEEITVEFPFEGRLCLWMDPHTRPPTLGKFSQCVEDAWTQRVPTLRIGSVIDAIGDQGIVLDGKAVTPPFSPWVRRSEQWGLNVEMVDSGVQVVGFSNTSALWWRTQRIQLQDRLVQVENKNVRYLSPTELGKLPEFQKRPLRMIFEREKECTTKDAVETCDGWAQNGECSNNSAYMCVHCPCSCSCALE